MNHLELSACIAQLGTLRYTPAGIPALDVQLDHASERTEAGQSRQVKASVKAVAFGAQAEVLVKRAVGSIGRFSGFLANPRNGKHPVLHIESIEFI